ncbi:hypothetical protein MBANPS3_010755 [Mucor bainieri]
MLTPHQAFVLERLPDLDVNDYYVNFGFKTRKNAEAKFRNAIEFVHGNTKRKELKQYLQDTYIDDDFEVLILAFGL